MGKKMKKIPVMLAVFMVVSAGSFAQSQNLNFNYGFWGRGVFTPLANSEGFSSVSAATATWDNGVYPRIGFTMNAYNGVKTIGIKITSFWETGVPSIGEDAHIWVKPLGFLDSNSLTDMVEMRIGKWEMNEFRGKIGAVEFGSWMVPDGVQDENAFFTRFASSSAFHLILRPLTWWDSPWNKLTFMAGVGSSYGGLRAYMNTWPWDVADVYAAGHYAIGYEIPRIGLARFQFIGNNRQVWLEDYPFVGANPAAYRLSQGLLMNRDADVLEAAFTFTGVEYLTIEAGIKIPFYFETSLPNYQYYRAVYAGNNPYATGSTYGAHTLEMQLPITISVGGMYASGDWDALLRVDAGFGGRYNDIGYRIINEGMTIGVLASAGYGRLAKNIRVGLDIGFNYKEIDTMLLPDGTKEKIGERPNDEETTERIDIGFAPWGQLNLGGGRIRMGVAIMLPSGERWRYVGGGGARPFTQVFTGAPVVSLPISVTYSF